MKLVLTRAKNVIVPFMVRVLSSGAFVSARLSGVIWWSFSKQFW